MWKVHGSLARALKPNSRTLCQFSGNDNATTKQIGLNYQLELFGNKIMERAENKVDELRRELKDDFRAAWVLESQSIKTELKGKIELIMAELNGKIAQLDSKIESTRTDLRSDVQILKERITLTWIGMGLVVTALSGVTGWFVFVDKAKDRFGVKNDGLVGLGKKRGPNSSEK